MSCKVVCYYKIVMQYIIILYCVVLSCNLLYCNFLKFLGSYIVTIFDYNVAFMVWYYKKYTVFCCKLCTLYD